MTPWQEVLKRAGFPTNVIVLDFETYFDTDYTLSKLSTVEYVADDRFELTGMGYQTLGDGSGVLNFLWPDDVAMFLKTIDFKNTTVVVQNGKFDCLVLQERFEVTSPYVVDVVDLDRMWDARAKHGLKHLAERWNAPSLKGDTMEFAGTRWADMDDVLRSRLREYCLNDVTLESWLFQKLMPLVVSRPEIELPVANQTLQMFLKPTFEIDMDLGRKIVDGMQAEMQRPIDKLAEMGLTITDPYRKFKNPDPKPRPVTREDVGSDKSFIALVEACGGSVPMKPGKNKLIPALAKDDEGNRELLSHPNPQVRALAEARQAIQSWPLHYAKVAGILAQAKCRGGRIGAPLKYYGAHTGRWSGSESINVQNLGGRGRGGKGTHKLIQQVRNILRAPKGYLLGVNDYSKVEAVGLAWQAGQDDLTKAFRTGADAYSDLATSLFGFPVRKPGKHDPECVKKRLEICRGFGKDAILGAGYGMGANKFYERCYTNDDLRPKFDDGTFGFEFIEHVIGTYRTKYSKIPEYWGLLEKSWRWSTKYAETVVLKKQNLEFSNDGSATFIRLPSGRTLRYPHAAVSRDNRLRYHWGDLWGGTLTENVVQALCRDLIAEAILRLGDNGFTVILTVHDEIVCLLEEATAEARLKEMGEIMCELPAWAGGFPLSVEGYVSEFYRK